MFKVQGSDAVGCRFCSVRHNQHHRWEGRDDKHEREATTYKEGKEPPVDQKEKVCIKERATKLKLISRLDFRYMYSGVGSFARV